MTGTTRGEQHVSEWGKREVVKVSQHVIKHWRSEMTPNCVTVLLQLCCYEYGSLIGRRDGSGGQTFYLHPRYGQPHIETDIDPKDWCCDKSDNCDIFYDARPLDACWGYVAPFLGQCLLSALWDSVYFNIPHNYFDLVYLIYINVHWELGNSLTTWPVLPQISFSNFYKLPTFYMHYVSYFNWTLSNAGFYIKQD